MKTIFLCLFLSALTAAAECHMLVVQGHPGEEAYATTFSSWVKLWKEAALNGGLKVDSIGETPSVETTDRERLKNFLEAEPKLGEDQLWIVLIGHGTFDGETARFNLRDSDLTLEELGQWLAPFQRPCVLIDLSAASAPLIVSAKGANRAIITATRSGKETNFARFGESFAKAIGSDQADLDRDGRTSLLDAFRVAGRETKEYYEADQRIPTEHAMLDDNSDGKGTAPEWFEKPSGNLEEADGKLASNIALQKGGVEPGLTPERRVQRDRIEEAIESLKQKKNQLNSEEYYRQLERLFLELARLNAEIESVK